MVIITLQTVQQNYENVFYETYKYGIHAEKNAIMNVKNKNILSECKMVIVRIYKGEIVNCEPCEKCEKLIDKFNIRKKKIKYIEHHNNHNNHNNHNYNNNANVKQ